MAKQKGRTVLIKIGDGATPTEAFDTMCALTTKTLTVNNETVDVTTANCTTPGGALWSEVMDGVKSITLAGNGVSKKDEAEARLAEVAISATPDVNMQVVIPNFGTFAGRFFISSMELGGEQSGGVTFSLSAQSTGAVTFTPEA